MELKTILDKVLQVKELGLIKDKVIHVVVYADPPWDIKKNKTESSSKPD